MGFFGLNISIRIDSPSKTETSVRHNTLHPKTIQYHLLIALNIKRYLFHHLCKQMSCMRSLQNCRSAFMWVRQRE